MKYNLVVPLSGLGSRFLKSGIDIPKPMLICRDKSIIEWGLSSFDYSESNLLFIVRQEHVNNYAIDKFLKQKFPTCNVFITYKDTKGATDTILKSEEFLQKDLPLVIYTSDTYFEPKFKASKEHFEKDGLILTFKANNPNYSYSLINNKGFVEKTVEKEVISDQASVGVYCFKWTERFLNLAREYVIKSEKECHVAPLYNSLIESGGVVGVKPIDKIHIMGTPEEFSFCENVSLKYLYPKKFAICSDHSGFNLKKIIKSIFDDRKIEYIDFGCYSERDCDYNAYVKQVANHMEKYHDFFGIGICRSGQGVNICANKHNGIRGALVTNQDTASLAIRHNAANFFSMPENIFLNNDISLLKSTLSIIEQETFDGGRHQCRLMKNDI